MCVCTCVVYCEHVCAFVCAHVCALHMCICVSMCALVYSCVCAVYMCVCVHCVCMCAGVLVGVRIVLFAHACVHMCPAVCCAMGICVHVCACECMRTSACMHVCAHLYVCTYAHVYECMCVHICVCVCARVPVCVCARRLAGSTQLPRLRPLRRVPCEGQPRLAVATSRCGHVSLWLRHQHVLPALPCCCRPWAEPRRSLPGARPHLACTGPWSHRAAPATPAGGRGASGRRGHAPSRPGTRVSPHRRSPHTPLTSRSLDRERPPALPPCPSTQRPLSSCTKRILPGIHELSPRCTSVGRGDAIAPPESSHMRAPRLF